MKVCLACSAGGHLTQILRLEDVWKKHPHFFVSEKNVDALELKKKEKVYFVMVPRRSHLRLLISFIQSFFIFLRERPDVVITTGADTAFATCILAKFFGKKLVFIESFSRITTQSLSGKLLYPRADLFLVQWPEQKKFYPKAEFAGSVF